MCCEDEFRKAETAAFLFHNTKAGPVNADRSASNFKLLSDPSELKRGRLVPRRAKGFYLTKKHSPAAEAEHTLQDNRDDVGPDSPFKPKSAQARLSDGS